MTTTIAAANAVVRKAIDAMIGAGREVGLQVAAYKDGKLVVDTWGGVADPGTGRKVDGDTLFNVYSVTKAVSATALHIQAERGLVDYDAPVAAYWPDFGAAGKGDVTVRHVLSHVSGVLRMPPDITPELMTNWDWMCGRIAEMPGAYPA